MSEEFLQSCYEHLSVPLAIQPKKLKSIKGSITTPNPASDSSDGRNKSWEWGNKQLAGVLSPPQPPPVKHQTRARKRKSAEGGGQHPKTTCEQKKMSLQCSALTHSFGACKNRATIVPASHGLPICWIHRKLGQTVASCQAVLGGNRKCLKKIPWSERRQLCSEHADFPLPCYILRLPTELRQQIFSYILDDYQSQYVQFYTYYSFLKMARLNRQIFEEASDILYRNFVCKIYLHHEGIYILQRKCLSVRPGSWQRFKQFRFTMDIYRHGKHDETLSNARLIAAQLHGANIKLHISVASFGSHLLDIHNTYNVLPLYLDAFWHLWRVQEARVTIHPDPSVKLKEIEERAGLSEETMAISLRWRRLYKEWVEVLEGF
ncbi:hypothetical protein CIHG_09846 [Coccidioides immitis H538.4]|uniref:F-box domain-containing protein n=1 Tax=Coccidioides immitis H538.4 TaxID=396776 RepID=A0A0J8UVW5_COCIT|nr:hypothetical protein CIHG_09846 [Coccidioides immitis H538.4]